MVIISIIFVCTALIIFCFYCAKRYWEKLFKELLYEYYVNLINHINKNHELLICYLQNNHEDIKNYIIPIYNNTIKLAKKNGIYYNLNQKDYENHKQKIINNNNS